MMSDMMVRGLIERDRAATRFRLTEQARAGRMMRT
jgi:hypothetical protein